jgi:hypothetical protein
MHAQLLLVLLLLSVHCRWAVGLTAGAVAAAVLLTASSTPKHLLLLLLLLLLVDAAAAGACCSICCCCRCCTLAASWSSLAAEAGFAAGFECWVAQRLGARWGWGAR